MSSTTYARIENYLVTNKINFPHYNITLGYIAYLIDQYEPLPLPSSNNFITAIIHAIKNETINETTRITPWDVKRALWSYPRFAEKYHIDEPDYLPVTVSFDGNSYIHEMTQDMMFGMFFYSLESKNKLAIQMFGRPVFGLGRNHGYDTFCRDTHKRYGLVIGEKEYCFLTLDLLQGWNTAKSWFSDTRKLYDYVIDYDTQQKFLF